MDADRKMTKNEWSTCLGFNVNSKTASRLLKRDRRVILLLFAVPFRLFQSLTSDDDQQKRRKKKRRKEQENENEWSKKALNDKNYNIEMIGCNFTSHVTSCIMCVIYVFSLKSL